MKAHMYDSYMSLLHMKSPSLTIFRVIRCINFVVKGPSTNRKPKIWFPIYMSQIQIKSLSYFPPKNAFWTFLCILCQKSQHQMKAHVVSHMSLIQMKCLPLMNFEKNIYVSFLHIIIFFKYANLVIYKIVGIHNLIRSRETYSKSVHPIWSKSLLDIMVTRKKGSLNELTQLASESFHATCI